MNTTGSDAEWVRLAGSILPLLLIVVIGMTLLLYRKELRDLIGGIKQVKYKEFTADFDSTAWNAFTAAAEISGSVPMISKNISLTQTFTSPTQIFDPQNSWQL